MTGDTARRRFSAVLTKTMASGTRRPGRGQMQDEKQEIRTSAVGKKSGYSQNIFTSYSVY